MKLLLIFLSFLFTASVAAQSASNFSSSKSYPPQNKAMPDENSLDYYKTETGATIDVKGAAKAEASYKKRLESMGYKYEPFEEGTKDYVPRDFEMPHNEILSGCIYTATFSFPDICLDDAGKVIFNYDKGDGQAVLDKIIKSQGKKGKYNKLPAVRMKDPTVR